MDRIIKFNKKACLKSRIDMNTDLRKKQKIIMKKILEIDEYCSFWKNHGKREKTKRC